MDVVRMVLTGQVQRGSSASSTPTARTPSASPARTRACSPPARRDVVVDGEPSIIGLVGEVTEVRSDFVRQLLDDGLVPVVSSVGRGVDGQAYNVNADTAAAALARSRSVPTSSSCSPTSRACTPTGRPATR